jgi:type IV pilus assembly protein PilC
MVRAGEEGGILDRVLVDLADHMEKTMKLKGKVKSALTYPVSVVIISMLAISIIMIYVVPSFSQMFSQFGAGLPVTTQIIIATSDFMTGWGGISIVLSMVLIIVGLKKYRGTANGRYQLDSLLLRLPLVGSLFKKTAVAHFSQTLGILLSSGTPILESLEITARTSGNKKIEKAIGKIESDIAEGKSIGDSLDKTGVFPPMVKHMISIGENSGTLDEMLRKIADFYDEEIDNSIASLTTLIEPLMIVLLGGVIGFIVVSLYMPMFQLTALMGGGG